MKWVCTMICLRLMSRGNNVMCFEYQFGGYVQIIIIIIIIIIITIGNYQGTISELLSTEYLCSAKIVT